MMVVIRVMIITVVTAMLLCLIKTVCSLIKVDLPPHKELSVLSLDDQQ